MKKTLSEMGLSKIKIGEMRIGEMRLGEMRLGEMLPNPEYITNIRINSAFHPSWEGKLSTGLSGWS